MQKYFYTDGNEKHGPYTLEELREINISRDTKVWFAGMDDWKPAGSIPELSELFKYDPPPISQSNVDSNRNLNEQTLPKTWLLESILVTICCCLPFGIAGIVNSSKVESRFYAGDIQGAKRASAEAKKWTTISFWIGLVFGGIYLIFTIAGLASGI